MRASLPCDPRLILTPGRHSRLNELAIPLATVTGRSTLIRLSKHQEIVADAEELIRRAHVRVRPYRGDDRNLKLNLQAARENLRWEVLQQTLPVRSPHTPSPDNSTPDLPHPNSSDIPLVRRLPPGPSASCSSCLVVYRPLPPHFERSVVILILGLQGASVSFGLFRRP